MEYKKYKSKVPERLSLATRRYDPYTRQQSQSCTRNSFISSKELCVPLSPIDQCLPTPPSCMYNKTSAPNDLFLPYTTFSSSLADSLLEEETLCRDNLVSSSPSYDLDTLANLSEEYYDAFMPSSTVSYVLKDLLTVTDDVDIFSNITEEFLSYLADVTPASKDFSALNDNILVEPTTASNDLPCLQPATVKSLATEPKPIPHNEITSNSTSASIDSTAVKISQVHTTKKTPHQISDSRLQCEYCPKKFNFRTSWTVHMRTHTGEKPYTCNICSRSFSDNSTYVKHIRTHTKEKPYSCDVCNKSFSQSGNLTRHKKTHKLYSLLLYFLFMNLSLLFVSCYNMPIKCYVQKNSFTYIWHTS